MTHVVGESCIGCKYTDCVAVCPVECFHEGPNFLVIDPEVCIDCGVCVAECPVEAIYDEKALPADGFRHDFGSGGVSVRRGRVGGPGRRRGGNRQDQLAGAGV